MDRSDVLTVRRFGWSSVRARLGWWAALSVPVTVLVVFFLVPVAAMVGRGFFADGRFAPELVIEALRRPRVAQVAGLTLWLSAWGTAVSMVVGVPAAYVLHRLRVPGARLLRAWLLVPFVLPTVVVGVAFRELFRPQGWLGSWGWDGTPAAIVAGLVFFNVSVVVRMVGAAWEGIDPRPAEAAATLGASPARVLVTVTLPQLRVPLMNAAVIVALFCATSFGVVLTLGGARYATIETEIYLRTTQLLDIPGAAALSVLQLLVVVALLATSARLDRGRGATEAGHPPRAVRRQDLPAVALTVVMAAALLVPLAALVVGASTDATGWTLAHFASLSELGRDTLDTTPAQALAQSLRTAFDATWLALVLGLPVALAVTRPPRAGSSRRATRWVEGAFLLPLGVSAVTLGFGLLLTVPLLPSSLGTSPLLVPLAQALVALPLVVRTLTGVLTTIDDRQRQAAASLGASPWRVLWTVDLPRIRGALGVSAGFACATSLGEFGATSFLARDDQPTLPLLIFRLLGHPGPGHYQGALAAAVVLGVVCAAVLLVTEWLSSGTQRGGVRVVGRP